jgi:hypothetical protein
MCVAWCDTKIPTKSTGNERQIQRGGIEGNNGWGKDLEKEPPPLVQAPCTLPTLSHCKHNYHVYIGDDDDRPHKVSSASNNLPVAVINHLD